MGLRSGIHNEGMEDKIQNTDQEQGQEDLRKYIKADMHDWRVERIRSCILREVREPSPVSQSGGSRQRHQNHLELPRCLRVATTHDDTSTYWNIPER